MGMPYTHGHGIHAWAWYTRMGMGYTHGHGIHAWAWYTCMGMGYTQVLSRRRKMLLDMTSGIELEMRDALGEDLVKVGIRILNKSLNYGPLAKDPDWFNDDENFAHVMQQTLYLQHGIVSEISRLAADNSHLSLRGWSMSGPSRMLLLSGWAIIHMHTCMHAAPLGVGHHTYAYMHACCSSRGGPSYMRAYVHACMRAYVHTCIRASGGSYTGRWPIPMATPCPSTCAMRSSPRRKPWS